MIEFKNLSKSYYSKELFKDLNLVIGKNEKSSIIGPNGSGKSTLFKIISNKETQDSGDMIFHVKNPKIGYMYQEISVREDLAIIDYLKKEINLYEIEIELRELEQDLNNDKSLSRYGDLLTQYEDLGGYEFEAEIEKILFGLGLSEDIGKSVLKLSSGQKNKISLALALYKGKDILLLDEPTNNLDTISICWLVDFIKKSKATILIISHDRDFLDNTTTKTYEIDVRNSDIIEYAGNYSEYKKFKEEKFEREMLEYEVRQGEIKKLKEAELEARKRMEKSEKKKPRDNDKGLYNFFLDKVTMSHGTKASFLSDRIEKMDNLEKPVKDKKIKYTIENSRNFGQILAEDLIYKYDNSDFELNIQKFEASKNDRIAIIGNNGSGKTTFIKILTGEILDFSGNLKISTNIKIADFNQEHNNLPKDKTPIELVRSEGNLSEIEANKTLSIFNLSHMQRYEKIDILSPGQRAKLLLTLFKIKEYNTLILDEPTNHLDLEALEVLENALLEFDGILIVISHDKRFLENLKLTKTYEFSKGELKEII